MRAGRDRLAALMEAGHKRARPIVMTSIAMIAGMIPIAVGWHGDNAFRAPMAIAVIGGIITSTGLTLLIVPAAFSIVDDVERWVAPRMRRLLSHEHHEPPAGDAGPRAPGAGRGPTPVRAARHDG